MYKIWEKNEKNNIDKKEYIDLYFFVYIGLGYLKVLCKNFNFNCWCKNFFSKLKKN